MRPGSLWVRPSCAQEQRMCRLFWVWGMDPVLRLIYFVTFLLVCGFKSMGQQPKSMHCNAGGAIDSRYYFATMRNMLTRWFGFRKKDGNGEKGVSTENWESLDKKNRAIAIGRGCPKMRKLETEIINGECSQVTTSALPTCASHYLI